MFTVLYGFATRVASLDNPLVLICWTGIWLNVLLGVFNLLPVPPLDGSWIASWGLPRKWGDLYDKYMEPYGFLILIGLFITGALGFIVGVIVWPVAFFLRDLVA
jgi:Zn-dependent protease